jgi:hypothetical protein
MLEAPVSARTEARIASGGGTVGAFVIGESTLGGAWVRGSTVGA